MFNVRAHMSVVNTHIARWLRIYLAVPFSCMHLFFFDSQGKLFVFPSLIDKNTSWGIEKIQVLLGH